MSEGSLGRRREAGLLRIHRENTFKKTKAVAEYAAILPKVFKNMRLSIFHLTFYCQT